MQMEPYKIHVLDSNTDDITHTYVFSQTPQDNDEKTTYVSNRMIYPDDSIHSIKLKDTDISKFNPNWILKKKEVGVSWMKNNK